MVTRIKSNTTPASSTRSPAGTASVQQQAKRSVRKAVKVVKGALGLQGERMSKVDTAWLRMDTASNLMMIVGVWVLRPGLRYEDLCARVEERLLKYHRFNQKVVEDAAGASWVVDADFDITHHVVREKLKLGRSRRGWQDALQERLGELTMVPLDKSRPLWQMHLVEDYDGGSAMIVRIHHCIADGIALIAVMQSLVDGGLPPPERKPKTNKPSGTGLELAEDWIAEALLKPLTQLTVKGMDMATQNATRYFNLLQQPQQGWVQSVDAAKLAYQVISDLSALALMPDDSATRLKGTPGKVKRVSWCAPIPLDEVKAVGKALNCSVNDVLLACVAGAIGNYLRERGEDPAGKEIRAMVPVNLRPMEQAYRLGNQFGLVPLVLPIGMDNPVERVYEVRRRMRDLKGSTQPVLVFALLAVAGLLIKPAQDALLSLFSKKTTAVMTNVPGPREKLTLCGSTIEENLFWVPQTGTVGMGVSILSYGGGVQFGVVTDAGLCPDPQAIIDEFEPEFARLSMITLMLPWGE